MVHVGNTSRVKYTNASICLVPLGSLKSLSSGQNNALVIVKKPVVEIYGEGIIL